MVSRFLLPAHISQSSQRVAFAWRICAAVTCGAFGAASRAQTPLPLPTYTFIDLGATLGQSVAAVAGKETAARGLNDTRAVVGDNGLYAMYGAGQGMIGWRQAPGTGAQVITNGTAFAINNTGIIGGARWLNASTTEAVRVVNGVVEPIVSLVGRSAFVYGISNTGYIVGEVANETTSTAQAFRWFQGTNTLIGAVNGYTEAFGVNDAGDVVGTSIRPGQNDGTAFLWRNGTMTFLTTTLSRADDINNNGLIVGSEFGNNISTAFKRLNSTHTPLGRLAGFSYHSARAVNDAGVIVGDATSDTSSAAVIWLNDQPRNLNTLVTLPLGWVLDTAVAINTNGDIAGTGRFGSQQRAYLLQAGPLSPAANPGRLTNLSVLTSVASAGDTFSLGFVVGGAGTEGAKPLIVRAAGPSLVPLGVSGALVDPKLELFTTTSKTAENDNWSGTPALTTGMAGVGAFAFASAASRDSAMIASVARGDNSVKVSAIGTGTGIVLAEIYDATPGPSFTTTTPRLVNVSVLKHLGPGLTVGFVVAGATSRTVLIRAVGPTLGRAPFNVGGVVTNPQLELFAGTARMDGNNDWGSAVGRTLGPDGIAGTTDDGPSPLDATLQAAFAQVGAFALPLGSQDAALIATLTPGNYSVQVSGVGSTTGIAIVEIYEVP
jgi:probable HAF family extracellular repeat protein